MNANIAIAILNKLLKTHCLAFLVCLQEIKIHLFCSCFDSGRLFTFSLRHFHPFLAIGAIIPFTCVQLQGYCVYVALRLRHIILLVSLCIYLFSLSSTFSLFPPCFSFYLFSLLSSSFPNAFLSFFLFLLELPLSSLSFAFLSLQLLLFLFFFRNYSVKLIGFHNVRL